MGRVGVSEETVGNTRDTLRDGVLRNTRLDQWGHSTVVEKLPTMLSSESGGRGHLARRGGPVAVEYINQNSLCCIVNGDGENLGDLVGTEPVRVGEAPGLALK